MKYAFIATVLSIYSVYDKWEVLTISQQNAIITISIAGILQIVFWLFMLRLFSKNI